MIDREPLDLFSDPGASTEQEDAAEAAPAGVWSCQWCNAAIPLGSTTCPVCGGNVSGRQLPVDPLTGEHEETLHYFEERGRVSSVATAAFEAYTTVGTGAERREYYQKLFEESLRLQALKSAAPQGAESEPVEQPRLCRWCNTVNSDEADFCISCGTRLPPRPVAEAEPVVLRCQWCAAAIEPGTTTCPACHGVATPDDSRQVAGLTELTAYEKAAEYAFSQEGPIRRPNYGLPSEIHRISRLGKAIFGKKD